MEIFDKTVQTTNIWRKEIEKTIGRIASEPTACSAPHIGPVNVEDATQVVFAIFGTHVSAGEIEDVREVLSAQLRSLWTAE